MFMYLKLSSSCTQVQVAGTEYLLYKINVGSTSIAIINYVGAIFVQFQKLKFVHLHKRPSQNPTRYQPQLVVR